MSIACLYRVVPELERIDEACLQSLWFHSNAQVLVKQEGKSDLSVCGELDMIDLELCGVELLVDHVFASVLPDHMAEMVPVLLTFLIGKDKIIVSLCVVKVDTDLSSMHVYFETGVIHWVLVVDLKHYQ